MGSWGASATGAPPVGRLKVATRFSFEKATGCLNNHNSGYPRSQIKWKPGRFSQKNYPNQLWAVSYSRAPKLLVGLRDNDKSQSKGAEIRSNSHYCSASATKAAQVRLRNIGSRCYTSSKLAEQETNCGRRVQAPLNLPWSCLARQVAIITTYK